MINFKKLKSQIKPFKPEAKHKGYIFIATDEQIANGGFTVAKVGSKRSLIDCTLLEPATFIEMLSETY